MTYMYGVFSDNLIAFTNKDLKRIKDCNMDGHSKRKTEIFEFCRVNQILYRYNNKGKRYNNNKGNYLALDLTTKMF